MGDESKRPADDLDLRAKLEEQARTIEEQQALITKLLKQIEALKNGSFGPSSEKRAEDWKDVLARMTGILPFPELEQIARELEEAKAAEDEERKRKKANAAKGKKRGPRSEFPDHLPRLIEELPVPVEERFCCGHERRSRGFEGDSMYSKRVLGRNCAAKPSTVGSSTNETSNP